MSEKKEEKVKGLKSFNEMMEIDLSKYTQLKPTFFKDEKTGKPVKAPKDKWLDYIEWGMVLALLYKNGAKKVTFWSTIKEDKPNTLDIRLVIDGEEYSLDYPIINGNAVITNPNQLQLHIAEMRGFVKCVAINTGLGLKLWLKEEAQLQDVVVEEPKKLEFQEGEFEKALEKVKLGKRTSKQIMDKMVVSLDQEFKLREAEQNRLSHDEFLSLLKSVQDGNITIVDAKNDFNLNDEQLKKLEDVKN